MLSENLSNKIRELAGEGSDPLAVAFSGGGDSTALLSFVVNALRNDKRDIYALIVDHDLRAGSGAEAKQAAARARATGAKTEILNWVHESPMTGIQEKARKARYALLGGACRRLNITKLFLGHNRDDQAETVYMRKQKHSGWRGLAGMQVQVMAPIWPALRGVEVIRPLLGQSRQSLRANNKDSGLEYIEDPSNQNLGFERIRARRELSENPRVIEEMIDLSRESQFQLKRENRSLEKLLRDEVEVHEWGGLVIRSVDRIAGEENLSNILRFVLPCVSGQSGFPPTGKLKNLAHRLQSNTFKGATIAGTRLIESGDDVLIVRDPGMVLGRAQKPALADINLTPGEEIVWDGRYLIETSEAGNSVVASGRCLDKMDKQTKARLKEIPLAARKTLPAIIDRHGNVTVPIFKVSGENASKTRVRSLISDRLKGFFQFLN